MDNTKITQHLKGVTLRGIHRYDGYKNKPVWELPDGVSSYNIYEADRQCVVSTKTIEELRKEFGVK